MEKYFKSYEEAADYVAYIVLIEWKKQVVQIEKLQMSDKEYFYKLTVEPYVEKVDSYPWAVTSPAIISNPNVTPSAWYDTLHGTQQELDRYKITCGNGSSSAMGDTTPLGHNPYQE